MYTHLHCVVGEKARTGPPPMEPGIQYLNPGEESQMVRKNTNNMYCDGGFTPIESERYLFEKAP